MKSKWIRFLSLTAVGLCLGSFVLLQRVDSSPAASGATSRAVAGAPLSGVFTLSDTHGKTVTEKSWPGKYKLVFFGFTHCPDTCPVTLQKLSLVMDNIDAKGEKWVPLFITVDPERDTQKVMAAYLKNYNPHIVGLTGTGAQVEVAEGSYKVFASRVEGATADDYMEDHSSYVYLMSPDNQLLEVLSADETAEGMINKIKLHSR